LIWVGVSVSQSWEELKESKLQSFDNEVEEFWSSQLGVQRFTDICFTY